MFKNFVRILANLLITINKLFSIESLIFLINNNNSLHLMDYLTNLHLKENNTILYILIAGVVSRKSRFCIAE